MLPTNVYKKMLYNYLDNLFEGLGMFSRDQLADQVPTETATNSDPRTRRPINDDPKTTYFSLNFRYIERIQYFELFEFVTFRDSITHVNIEKYSL